MKQIEVLAPAKINLFLKIVNKRIDGFHDLETVFEKVSLFDKLTLKEVKGENIVLTSNSRRVPLNKDNTVYKAIELVRDKFKIKRGISVHIEKNIPQRAGLGGGSSDAVAALRGINELWRLGLSTDDMLDFAKQIGSDVALFVLKDSFLLGKGRGERLTPIRVAKGLKLWHILITPNFGISTPLAYHLFDKHFMLRSSTEKALRLKLTIPDYSANIITHALFNRDVSLLNYYSYNSFAGFLFKDFPRLASIKKSLEEILFDTSTASSCGKKRRSVSTLSFCRRVDFIHVSGSGPTLFLTFSGRKEASETLSKIEKRLEKDRCQSFLVHTN